MPNDGNRASVTAVDELVERKAAHLDICGEPDQYQVQHGSTLLENVRFVHRALPELSVDAVDTTIDFLGHRCALPIFISSMTGGSADGYRVNQELAKAAQQLRVPVGMGSIRILLRKPAVLEHFQLRRWAPDVALFANIGAVQLRDPDQSALIEVLRRLEVDAVAVHLNPGQELFQPRGDRDFSGILAAIGRFCELSPVPVIVKETGFGIAPADIALLLAAGVALVDVAGGGGTNWVAVEAYRASAMDRRVAASFNAWGLPTGLILAALWSAGQGGDAQFRGRYLASGGVYDGVDVAKALALGAAAAGAALPFARAVRSGGADAVVALLEEMALALRTVMVLTGCRTIADLRTAALLIAPDLLTASKTLARVGPVSAATPAPAVQASDPEPEDPEAWV